MSASDKRLAELLDRWQTSLQLHARYLELDDAAYARAQAWPRHQRPTRWVIDLAQTRLGQLAQIAGERQAAGDEKFAEALELMAFLTTLLGSEHVERFIPLATGKVDPSTSATVQKPRIKPVADKVAPTERTAARKAAAAAKPTATAKAAAKTAAAPAPPDKMAQTVIADAVRFLGWGREWPQLAGLIARLADRPGEQDIWKILRAHRAAIEAKARAPRD